VAADGVEQHNRYTNTQGSLRGPETYE